MNFEFSISLFLLASPILSKYVDNIYSTRVRCSSSWNNRPSFEKFGNASLVSIQQYCTELNLSGLQKIDVEDVWTRHPNRQTAPAPTGVALLDKDLVKEAVKEAHTEIEKEKESKTLVFSKASFSALQSYLETLRIAVFEEELNVQVKTGVDFEKFVWNGSEEDCTGDAIAHCRKEFGKFGVKFGRGGFELYDVHDIRQLLSLDDSKSGKLSGGTDVILGPHGVANVSIAQFSCVAIELKSEECVANEVGGFEAFFAQATLELIASCYHSYQMALVVLTDLSTGACLFTISRGRDNNVSILKYGNLSLNQMASAVAHHLERNCTADKVNTRRKFNEVDQGAKEADFVVQAFKKQFVTPVKSFLAYEQFISMLEDTEVGSRERAQVIQTFFRANELPNSSYLSMFA